jgi:seryl-tRNA synthetase
MLDIKTILANPDEVIEKLKGRGVELDLSEILAIDKKRRSVLQKVEGLRFELNKSSKLIGRLKKEKKDASSLMSEMKKVSEKIKGLDEELKKYDDDLRELMLSIPNIPHDSVPVGKDSSENPVVRVVGDKPDFSFAPKPHWDIGTDLKILDFERAAKLAGSRFAVYLGDGARLERALINFMLDIHTRDNKYTEMIPPFIANAESLYGTGNLPKFEEDLFKLKDYPWYLIPTAEVPLTNYFRNDILNESDLPYRFCAYTPCFRSEAGSYGKDIRGLVRQHQFNKVEMVIFSLPENSYQELEKLTNDAEEVLRRLELPYRVISLCTGDLGFAGAKTYDLEVWMPQRNAYLEISSCTNCDDFQARRANIRFRRKNKPGLEFVHTLNGSGVAIGRTVSAILECNQQEDGSVLIPKALRPYMGGLERITAH